MYFKRVKRSIRSVSTSRIASFFKSILSAGPLVFNVSTFQSFSIQDLRSSNSTATMHSNILTLAICVLAIPASVIARPNIYSISERTVESVARSHHSSSSQPARSTAGSQLQHPGCCASRPRSRSRRQAERDSCWGQAKGGSGGCEGRCHRWGSRSRRGRGKRE